MGAIAGRTKQRFKHQALKDLVDYQTQKGIREYGQTLDENTKPASAKAVHIIQEAIDLMQYLEWIKDDLSPMMRTYTDVMFSYLSSLAEGLLEEYPDIDLTHKEGFRE